MIVRIGQRFIRWWWTPLRLTGVALLVLAFLVGALGYLNEHGGLYLWETPRRILEYLSANVSTELASIAITMLFVDALYEHRETEREKKRLILQVGSPDNAFAQEATRALQSRGWLQDGSLKGARLAFANLQGADLAGANLQGADLVGANLQGADLRKADLQRANLGGANLQEASLRGANLQGAYLGEADLQGAILGGADFQGAHVWGAKFQEANLWSANLQGVDLRLANLQEAHLEEAQYNNATKWPDGFTPPPEAVNVDAETNIED